MRFLYLKKSNPRPPEHEFIPMTTRPELRSEFPNFWTLQKIFKLGKSFSGPLQSLQNANNENVIPRTAFYLKKVQLKLRAENDDLEMNKRWRLGPKMESYFFIPFYIYSRFISITRCERERERECFKIKIKKLLASPRYKKYRHTSQSCDRRKIIKFWNWIVSSTASLPSWSITDTFYLCPSGSVTS